MNTTAKTTINTIEAKVIIHRLRLLRNIIMNEDLSHKAKTIQYFETNAYIRGVLISTNISINKYDLVTKYLDRLVKTYDLYIVKYL